MSRAVVAPRYGEPEVVEIVDVEVPAPGPGEVTIAVRAAGVNPTDYKGFSGRMGADPARLPMRLGYEVAGVISAIGPHTELASGGGAVGDEVLAFRVTGGYADAVTVRASDVFAKPANLSFPEAANLLLVGATAADMLRVVTPRAGSTVLVHGASGSVGVSLLQQLADLGVQTIGTASEARFEVVRRFGGEPIAYGEGLEERLRQLPQHIDAAYDTVGTPEAVEVSLALVAPDRIVTIAAHASAKEHGFAAVGGAGPESGAFRERVRARLVATAADGRLQVPLARTFPLAQAAEALALVATGHPGGKVALVP